MNLPAQDHRLRLLRALEHVLSEKSYRDVTLSDITAAAKVSRRTFYEHFANKDECLLALSEDTCQRILTLVIASFSLDDDWPGVVTKVTRTYLSFIDAHPSLMLALYVETSTLGQAGLASRRKVSETFAEFLRSQTAIRSARGEEVDEINGATAITLVAGINELVLYRLQDRFNGGEELMTLQETASSVVLRMTGCLSAMPA
ncbi:MAG: TetR/AcrR family transcriptional regulator [Thalassolituus sp.]